MDCTGAGHPSRWGSCWCSVQWNETGDTSSGKDSLDTEEHPGMAAQILS